MTGGSLTNQNAGAGRSGGRRVLVVVIALVVALVAGGIVVIVRIEATSQVRFVVLPDGSRVEILGVAPGGQTVTTDKPWLKFARRWAPGFLQGRIPAVLTGNCSSDTNSLVVYVRVITPGTTATSGPLPWSDCQAEDKDGFRYPRSGGSCSFSSGPGMTINGLVLNAYPRRQEEFSLRLVDAKGELIATLPVKNPNHGPFPVWQALPVPQTQTNGPVRLTLKALVQHEYQSGYFYITPTWDLKASDPKWEKAATRYVNFEDATGNEGGVLSRRETAWKARAVVSRERLEDFLPEEKFALTNLAIPKPGTFAAVDKSATCTGVSIQVRAIVGAGQLVISNGTMRAAAAPGVTAMSSRYSTSTSPLGTVETIGKVTPFLVVDVNNVQPADDFKFSARDDLGRTVETTENGWNSGASGLRTYTPGFKPSEGAKSITLTVVVNRPLIFEFMVNPADISVEKR